MPASRPDMRGRVCLVTGASSGLGLETALGLARAGANLILVGRDPRRSEEARARIRREAPQARLDLRRADFESLADVRALAASVLATHGALHVLVNNAGAFYPSRRITADGFEATWQVNHLAPFLLTNLLLDRLAESAPARVVTVASEAHRGARIDFDDLEARHGYAMLKAYGRSKLANILFAFALARRLEGRGVTSNCLHPGVVATRIGNRGLLPGLVWTLMKPFMLPPERGAETTLFLAASPDVAGTTGVYFIRKRPAEPDSTARDLSLQERLWNVSARMAGLPA